MLTELTDLYDAYVDSYRDSSGILPEMMALKREHTYRVVANARLIADGEGFVPEVREAVLAASLLHDTGRYEQLRLYNTFKDSDSVDHAVLSHDTVVSLGWLDAMRVPAPTIRAILDAVRWHNRRDLPAQMDALTADCVRTVRDADKLDIFRVLEDRVERTDWRRDSTVFWNLAVDAPPSASVVAAIEAQRPVDYQDIRTLADFVLIQVGWMISGLVYGVSRRLCRDRGHLAYRRRFLHELTDDPAVDRICDVAETC